MSGHEKGAYARKRYNLDAADKQETVVEVVIPGRVDAVATFFFQGMFSGSVRHYKTKERFLEHYRFNATPMMMEQVIRGIERLAGRLRSI